MQQEDVYLTEVKGLRVLAKRFLRKNPAVPTSNILFPPVKLNHLILNESAIAHYSVPGIFITSLSDSFVIILRIILKGIIQQYYI